MFFIFNNSYFLTVLYDRKNFFRNYKLGAKDYHPPLPPFYRQKTILISKIGYLFKI